MQYLLLIYDQEQTWDKLSENEQGAILAAYGKFTHSIRESNQFVAGDALMPVSTATTVRVRNGKTTVTDGPFAETKEQLGGYYLIEAENLDQATTIAARIPTAQTGCIEIRPIMVYEQ